MIPSNNNIGIIKNNTTNRARETTPLYGPARLARRPIMRTSRKRGEHERTYPRDPSTTTTQHPGRCGATSDHQVILINSLTQKYNILLSEGASERATSRSRHPGRSRRGSPSRTHTSHTYSQTPKEERQVAQNDDDDARSRRPILLIKKYTNNLEWRERAQASGERSLPRNYLRERLG